MKWVQSLLMFWVVLIPFWALMKYLFEGPVSEPAQLWLGWPTLFACTLGWAVSFLLFPRVKS